MSLAYRLKQLCQKKGISHAELAKGIFDVSFFRKVNLEKEMNVEMLHQLAKRLNVNLDYLTGAEQEPISRKVRDELVQIRQHLYHSSLTIDKLLEQLEYLSFMVKDLLIEPLYLDYLITKCMVTLRSEEWQSVKKTLKCIERLNVQDYPEENFRLLRVLSIVAYKEYRIGEAIDYLESALKLGIDKDKLLLDYALVFYNLALYYQRYSDYNNSRLYIDQAINLINKNKFDLTLLADCYLIKGIIYLQKKELIEAQHIFSEALICGEETGNDEIIINAYHNLAIVQKERKESPVLLYQEILDFIEDKQFSHIKVATLYNLCLYLFEENLIEELEIRIHELEDCIEQSTDTILKAGSLRLIGRFFHLVGLQESYITFLLKACQQFEEVTLWKECGEIYYELGKALDEPDYLIKAAEYYHKSSH